MDECESGEQNRRALPLDPFDQVLACLTFITSDCVGSEGALAAADRGSAGLGAPEGNVIGTRKLSAARSNDHHCPSRSQP